MPGIDNEKITTLEISTTDRNIKVLASGYETKTEKTTFPDVQVHEEGALGDEEIVVGKLPLDIAQNDIALSLKRHDEGVANFKVDPEEMDHLLDNAQIREKGIPFENDRRNAKRLQPSDERPLL